jgi:hypothetical protein
MSDASFQIVQSASTPGPDIARRDILPNSVAGLTSFEAVTGGLTYEWIVIQPPGTVPVPLTGSAAQICTMAAEEGGGYSVKLTTNKGLPTEDIKILYMGLPMITSNLPLPALNETNIDNSVGTPELGWWEKMFLWMSWVEANISGGGGSLPTYIQDAEPGLLANGDAAFWIDTDDSNRTWLLYRRGLGDQLKVELS